MWATYSSTSDRDAALSVTNDSRGFPWLSLRGQSLGVCPVVMTPNGGTDFSQLGEQVVRWADGESFEGIPYADMPKDYWDSAARLAKLAPWEIDECVLFPHHALVWEDLLWNDEYATKVNMSAWNRWAVEVAQTGRGRLHPVGHVRLDVDPRWLEAELGSLASAGIRLAMMAPTLVGGRRFVTPQIRSTLGVICCLQHCPYVSRKLQNATRPR